MTLVQKTFDDQPSGTVAAPTNTGASSINTLSGGSVTYDSGMAARGTQCGLKMVATGSGSAADIRYAVPSNSQYAVTFVQTMPAVTPSGDVRLFQADADTARAFALIYSSTNQLKILDSVNGSSTVTTTLTPGARYRVGVVCDNTGGTAAGKITVNVYTETGTTPLGTASSTTANLSTGGFITLRCGATAFPSEGATIGVDDLQWNDGATTEISGFAAQTALHTPVAILTPDGLVAVEISTWDGSTLR